MTAAARNHEDVSKWDVATLPEVAKAMGVSLSTVNRWRAMGMPGSPGRWNLAYIVRWSLSEDGPYRSERYIRTLQREAYGRPGD